MKQLYALVVGIDKYTAVAPLQGCVNDATMVADYLKKNINPSQLTLNLVTLFNEQATRDNIIKNFLTHLGQAKKDDVALFFFAGHGGQEAAHEFFFKIEPDKKLETLVCIDSRLKGVRDIADKELRSMIYKIAGADPLNGPHVVIVQDNCHSGGASRSANDSTLAGASKRLAPGEEPARDWKDYVFANEVDIASRDTGTKTLDQLFPQGVHVQIAACAPDEFAWETTHLDGKKGGVFTRRFLEILNQTKGNITYYDLQTRIRGRIGNQGKDTQTPNMYIFGNPNNAYRQFIYGTPDTRPTTCNVLYNPTLGWHIDIGAFHNVPADVKVAPTKVLAKENSKATKVYTANVIAVEGGRSKIQFIGEEPVKEMTYIGEVQGVVRPKLRVFLDAAVTASGVFAKFAASPNSAQKAMYANLSIVAAEKDAQYVVRQANAGKLLVITLPNDPSRPLVKAVAGIGDASAAQILEQLEHIGKWETTKQVNNPATKFFPNPPAVMEVINFQNGNPITLPISNGVVDIDLANPEVEIRITSVAGQPIHVGALQLDQPFKIDVQPIAGYVVKLAKGEQVYLTFESGNSRVWMGAPQFITDFNWQYYEFFIKVLISSTPFDTTSLFLSPLPEPTKDDFRGENKGTTRGFGPPPAAPALPDWMAYNVKFRVKNPNYQAPKVGLKR